MPSTPPKRHGANSLSESSPRKLRKKKETFSEGKSDTPSAKPAFKLDSMKDALARTAEETKENFTAECFGFGDESNVVTLSGIENFFLQGKALQVNRTCGGRRKGKNLLHQADANPIGEGDGEEDDDMEGSSEIFTLCDLGMLRNFLNSDGVKLQKQEELERLRKKFPWWTFCLAGGFNVLLYGVGSKRALLNAFREDQLKVYRTLTIDGFREDVTSRTILINIVDCMHLERCEQKRHSLVDWAKLIASTIERKKQQLVIILNNIDSPNLRDSTDQEVLAALVGNPAISIIASVDHINATLLWTNVLLESFRWVYCRADTYTHPTDELLAGQSSLLGLNPETNHSAHSLSSLDVLWQSLATNSRSIFRLFYAMFLTANEPVSFWDLFSAAKDDFLVSSDIALRQQLVEFNDHRVLRWKRGDDGKEQLVGTLEKSLVEKFLNEKGLNLEYV